MAQHDTPAHSGATISLLRVDAYEHATVVVASAALGPDGRLDPVHARSGDDTSPPLEWTAILEAETYALIVEDPDAPRERPMVHWVLWNIPGRVNALPAGVEAGAHPTVLPGAVQGRNGHGEHGWTGMAPPPGAGPHRYHFQVFAVAKRLGLGPEASLEHLVEALKGATLAKGELVGLYETPDAS